MLLTPLADDTSGSSQTHRAMYCSRYLMFSGDEELIVAISVWTAIDQCFKSA